ncbi:MAG: Eco57I restriction-modification methylase domain-containing protein [Chloracidobacterium sp.]|nr:Eco57I restriction-modification methylase domain-containing protein [Chloracidobacterium sp.]
MNEEQARSLIKDVFQSRFAKPAFEEFLSEFLPSFDLTKAFGPLSGNVIRAAFRDRIASYERVGQYADPDQRKIDVLIINLNRETTLQHGRTGLRNFAADYLQSDRGLGKTAVLLAYVPSDGGDWRFSFVTLETSLAENEKGRFKEVVDKITPARRKSFLVGESEKSHTAQSRFVKWIGSRNAPTVQEIEDCFDVEAVTKEFFNKYKVLFERTRAAILDVCEKNSRVKQEFLDIGLSKKAVDGSDNETLVPNADDFAKKLLGQVVFLYFLQRKGWFGVQTEWGDGDKKFLRHLFENREDYLTGARTGKKCNYFNDILEPLFYEALAYPRDRDYSKQFDCKIPFLNGGLFEPIYGYNWQQFDLLLPDDLFSNNEKTKDGDIGDGILDIFDRYNFTVNESEPLETEVAVDPEMLGKVFENLLPEHEKKGKGAYYTPRPIVAYMCQQSLINYLDTHFANIARDDLETFIIYGERHADFEARSNKANEDKLLPDGIRANARKIDKRLANIKVCDPAIGSGAFPVGMMHEIVRARQTLASIGSMPEKSAYELKRHAIENSLYGVDIDSGAVEIAKLRLWLSLVVDEEDRKTVQPLPNLDFKIMQGDSLIDEFRGIRLFDDAMLDQKAALTHDSEQLISDLKEKIAKKTQEFFLLHQKGDAAAIKLHAVEKDIVALKVQLDGATGKGKDRKAAGESLYNGSEEPSKVSIRFAELQKIHQAIIKETNGERKRDLRAAADRLEHEFVSENLREVEKAVNQQLKKLRQDLDGEVANVKATMKSEIETPKIQKLKKQIVQKQKELSDLGETQEQLAMMDFSKFKPFFLWHLHFFEIFQTQGGFDVVLGNPPYLKIQNISDEIAKILKSKYVTATGKFDIYVTFIEKSFALLNHSGVVLFIHPHRFLTADYGNGLKKLLDDIRGLRSAILFGIQQIFETATTYTGIFEYSNNNVSIQVKEVGSKVFQHIPFSTKQYSNDASHWRTLTSNEESSSLVGRLSSFPNRLTEVFEGIYQGIVTVGDEIFTMRGEMSKNTTKCYSEAIGAQIEIESSMMRHLLKGEDIRRYEKPVSDLLLFYPHYIDSRGKTVPLEESKLRAEFPLAYRYIAQFKKQLIEKKIKYKTNPKYWYSLHRSRDLKIFEGDKIITPYLQNSPNFAFDRAGWLTNTKGYVLVVSNEMEFNYKYLLGVLNSPVLWYFIKQTSSPFSGAFYEFTTNNFGRFTVPNCEMEAQKLIATIVDYVLYLKGIMLDETDSARSLMIAYFEQVINGLVYELYLAKEIQEAQKYFFKPLKDEKLPAVDKIHGDKLAEIRRIFECLFDRNHVIRKNIFFLDTLEIVRIIEGKA